MISLKEFFSRIKKTRTCWLWTGAGQKYGNYGPVLAHRISYELSVGPIPKGKMILHKCDVPKCVRPSHLFVGTQKDNMSDCWAKGRHPWKTNPPQGGESHWKAKLTARQVVAIFNSRRPGFILAEKYGISRAQVCAIKHGRSWSKITAPSMQGWRD